MTTSLQKVEGHEFKVRERVYVLDPNNYDVWEAVIKSMDGNKIELHYPDFPTSDEVVENEDRIFVQTKENTRIFRKQEADRAQNARGSDDTDDGEEEEYGSADSEDSDGFMPSDDDEPAKKRGRKPGKVGRPRKNNDDDDDDEADYKVKRPRPAGCRMNPKRGA